MPDRPLLDLPFCLNIVILSTGRGDIFATDFDSDPATLLAQLGVVDDFADAFKAQIQKRLGVHGYSIKQSDIDADPTDTVKVCTFSVRNHAH